VNYHLITLQAITVTGDWLFTESKLWVQICTKHRSVADGTGVSHSDWLRTGGRSSFPARRKNFPFASVSKPAAGPSNLLTGGCFPEGRLNQSVHDANSSPASRAEGWSYISTRRPRFTVSCSVNPNPFYRQIDTAHMLVIPFKSLNHQSAICHVLLKAKTKPTHNFEVYSFFAFSLKRGNQNRPPPRPDL
jgi:hypothetical protein